MLLLRTLGLFRLPDPDCWNDWSISGRSRRLWSYVLLLRMELYAAWIALSCGIRRFGRWRLALTLTPDELWIGGRTSRRKLCMWIGPLLWSRLDRKWMTICSPIASFMLGLAYISTLFMLGSQVEIHLIEGSPAAVKDRISKSFFHQRLKN